MSSAASASSLERTRDIGSDDERVKAESLMASWRVSQEGQRDGNENDEGTGPEAYLGDLLVEQEGPGSRNRLGDRRCC